MKFYKFFCILLIPIFVFSCTERKTENAGVKNDQKIFIPVSVPQEITNPKEKVDYLLTHYWDNFDFSDTTYIGLQNVTERALIDYINILSVAEKDTAYAAIAKTLNNAGKKDSMRVYFLSLFKKYLYDPNSPLRSEEYYIPVLKYIISSDRSDSTDVVRAKFDLDMALKNRVGDKAANIKYTLSSGATGTLYSIKKEYTIILFYNPGCEACAEVIAHMKRSPVLNIGLQSNLISILAFYPDADIKIWREHISDIPEKWINGYDKEGVIDKKRLYDLKAIPTLYLLDKEHKVILKDASINIIERYLKDNNPMIFVR